MEATMNQPSGFIWYELMTKDMDAAISFYEKVVGWSVHDSGMPGMRYEMFGMNGKDVGGIMDWKSVGAEMPTEWMAHIHTADVDRETAAVVADGGSEIQPPKDIPGVGRFSVVGDPQGAKYLLFQPNGATAPPRLGQNEVGNVGWHELITSDWKKAWDFYSKHYGWQKDYAMDMKELGLYQTFRTTSDRYTGAMMNTPPFIPDKTPGWLFYFQVEDVGDAAKRVAVLGGQITQGPMDVPGSRIAQAIDPQGGRFALVAARES